jgi:hypothetical protein
MLGRTGDRIVRDWLKRGILVERETSVLTSAADAIAAAKLRGRDVAGAIPGKNLTAFVWWTPPARFWAFSPRIPMPKGDKPAPLADVLDVLRQAKGLALVLEERGRHRDGSALDGITPSADRE